MKPQIRPIKLSEVYRLRKLFQRALHEDFAYFPGEYITASATQNNLTKLSLGVINPHRVLLGVFIGKGLIGYAIADSKLKTEADIFWLYVSPEMRGGGLGREVLDNLLGELTRRGVAHVYLITHQQQDFYRRFGFETITENEKLFSDMVIYEMAKDLK